MKKTLKLLISVAVLAIPLYSCTPNQSTKKYGGEMVIDLPKDRRLVNITWKSDKNFDNLWILTKSDTTKPSTYYFEEKSTFGILEGKITINEK